MSPNTIGALLMIASMACFTFNDTLLKMTDGALPLFQLLFLRGATTTVLILALSRQLGRIDFRLEARDWRVIGLRSVAEIAAAYFFLTALFNMPLANVTAILQVVPLSVTLAAALVLRQAVGWRRLVAIGIGFCGVLLIVKPGAEGFNIWSIYVLIAVLCVTVRDLSTRALSPAVPSMTVTLITALSVMTAAGFASLSAPWAPVTPSLAVLIGGSGVFVLGGYFFSIQVMRVGDVAFVAPFRYTGLLWALLLGWFIFGDWPGTLTMIGAGIVVATGVFTLYRERALKIQAEKVRRT
ncbi:Riboflavin transporter [Sulfitobacter indolifex]|uniref:Integral membrane protein, putative n=1 Tax=Sulfitobacter indolifex HEL-45 TaxID=391624 RepID=A0ABM9XB64_9RHOB|nr:DMT family transporter [Sulfitobacter indolifex]EDQ06756.1 integral membrane protein, putative [Sulfitobacter indolifex HEL-45]UOA17743.1 Riboflavin transporter [Sulfitobacter indolifex]